MPSVQIAVNGRNYEVACDAGQEQHLRDLARSLDGRIRQLIKTAGPASEGRLLLMAGLLIADELHEARIELDRLQSDRGPPRSVLEQQLADTLEQLASRLESIAAQLEAA
jgi:cell division protein ZapA